MILSIKGFKVNGTTYQYDYPENDNLPSINSVILSGNKTASDLGLVNAEVGKGLSTNDYTTADKNKVAALGNVADLTYITVT